MASKSKSSNGTKTYILNMNDNTRQKVTVPAEWKVTFGALWPSSTNNNGRSALRFWEGNKENQRAVFTDVASFRDDSIQMEVEVVDAKEQALVAKTEFGDKTVIVRGETRQWMNPDDPKAQQAAPQFLRLTTTPQEVAGAAYSAPGELRAKR